MCKSQDISTAGAKKMLVERCFANPGILPLVPSPPKVDEFSNVLGAEYVSTADLKGDDKTAIFLAAAPLEKPFVEAPLSVVASEGSTMHLAVVIVHHFDMYMRRPEMESRFAIGLILGSAATTKKQSLASTLYSRHMKFGFTCMYIYIHIYIYIYVYTDVSTHIVRQLSAMS